MLSVSRIRATASYFAFFISGMTDSSMFHLSFSAGGRTEFGSAVSGSVAGSLMVRLDMKRKHKLLHDKIKHSACNHGISRRVFSIHSSRSGICDNQLYGLVKPFTRKILMIRFIPSVFRTFVMEYLSMRLVKLSPGGRIVQAEH